MANSVTNDNFNTEVLQSTTPVLVDFWAEWCGPCKMLNPIIEQISTEYKNKIKILKCDVDNNQELAAKYNVRGIPSLILFKDGQVAATHIGLINKNDLAAFIDANS